MLLYDGVIVEREAFTCVYSQLAKQRSLSSGIPKDIGQTSLGTMLTRLRPLESTCALWSRVWPPTCLYSLCPAGLPLALSYHNRPFEGQADFLLLLSTH